MVEPICNLEGRWTRNLVIDGKEYWNIERDLPSRFLPLMESESQRIAPSDWRFREDLIWLKYNYQRIASKWKVRQEEQQRHDRKLRLKRNEERRLGL